MIYTFSPEKRDEAIELAAKMACEGKEATIKCGDSNFTASPNEQVVREYAGGEAVAHHYWKAELLNAKWQFAGITETKKF